ncbi:hypothetical protein ACFY0G_32320 [Streptomyces sp. NPDC001552]|uniref:hypothetical protein n=1 Tax=Streptomyces sp. NPDC001552 TaxID=3364587 RepID=UPI0036AA67E9
MDLPDLVVPVREAKLNQQLRYALRSWAKNLPHGRVWLVGYRPYWVAGVNHISTTQAGRTKYANTTAAVRAVCEHPEVSDPWILLNDDFFVMTAVEQVPALHRGRVVDVERYYAARASGSYLDGMRATRARLAELGHPDPLSYELHVPMQIGKAGMLAALDAGRDLAVVHKRTLYGNLAGLGGAQIDDVKILHRSHKFPADSPFLSTMPDSFTRGKVGELIRRKFPQPCPYELRGIR